MNGVGFIVDSIDIDDFECACQCGRQYPVFQPYLDDYNDAPPPPPCCMFDRCQTVPLKWWIIELIKSMNIRFSTHLSIKWCV